MSCQSSCTDTGSTVAVVDFVVYQGDDYFHSFIWKDADGNLIDLTGYTAKLQVREKISSASALFEVTELDGITLGGPAGTIDVRLSGANTSLITKNSVYDLELTDATGVVTTLVRGDVCLTKEVTR